MLLMRLGIILEEVPEKLILAILILLRDSRTKTEPMEDLGIPQDFDVTYAMLLTGTSPRSLIHATLASLISV